MSNIVIRVENLSKSYQYGTISHGTLQKDLQSWWARLRGKADPNTTVYHTYRTGRSGERFWALHEISFDVQQGEILGIIGRNGAGKSTLLKILSQITSPTVGCAKLKGRIGSLLEVGTGFHPELTGRENVYLNGAILGMNKAEITRKFDEIVAFAEIEEFIDTPVKRYSSGMYVRLAFAVAAHLEPEILLVDEVLAVGDVEFQRKCLGKMGDVAKTGRTVLFVSHNLVAVSSLCSRLLLLEEGKISYRGEVDEGINTYLGSVDSISTSDVNIEFTTPRHGVARFSRIISIATLNADNQPTGRFRMGEPMKLRFCIRLTEDVKNLEIGWGLKSLNGAVLQGFVANWEGMKTEFSKGEHCIICEVSSLNLFPNSYTITPWIKRIGDETDDYVDRAIKFEVVGNNITGYHQYFERYPNSGIFQRSKWTVEES